MLTINLIPRYYFEQRLIKRLMMFFGMLLGVVVVGMILAMVVILGRIGQANTRLAEVEPIAQQVEALESQAKQLRDEVAPIKAKITYIRDVMNYNTVMIPLLQELSRYTYKTVTYGEVAPSGNTLTIKGWAPSMVDAGRYLLGLYRATHLFSNVSFSGVPGYRQGAEGGGGGAGAGSGVQSGRLGFSFTATCTLLKPLTAPTYSGPTAGGAAGAPGGATAAAGSPPPNTLGPEPGGAGAGAPNTLGPEP